MAQTWWLRKQSLDWDGILHPLQRGPHEKLKAPNLCFGFWLTMFVAPFHSFLALNGLFQILVVRWRLMANF